MAKKLSMLLWWYQYGSLGHLIIQMITLCMVDGYKHPFLYGLWQFWWDQEQEQTLTTSRSQTLPQRWQTLSAVEGHLFSNSLCPLQRLKKHFTKVPELIGASAAYWRGECQLCAFICHQPTGTLAHAQKLARHMFIIMKFVCFQQASHRVKVLVYIQ